MLDAERCTRHSSRWRCTRRRKKGFQYCAEHIDQRRARDKRSWQLTVNGTAHDIRHKRGYEAHEAQILARRLHDPNEECGICGVPAHVIWKLWERGGPFATLHLPNCNRRLTVDRIDVYAPHTLANTRLACWPCNARRNRLQKSVEEVRRSIRRWWAKRSPVALRGWLDEQKLAAS